MLLSLCKALKKITVKSMVLSSVGKNALKNIYKKAVITVSKKKLTAYKTLFKGKRQKKSVKIKKNNRWIERGGVYISLFKIVCWKI